MSEIIAFSGFILVASTFLSIWFASHLMYWKFLSKHPDEALDLIPYSEALLSRPEKLFFFFRKRNREMLKKDDEVWRLRKVVLALLFALSGEVLVFFGIFAAVVILAG
jgi:hypothetical protein